MPERLKQFIKKARRKVFKPVFKVFFMRLIVFYQKNFSRHTCLYEPTCSEYMRRALNNHGVVIGLMLGIWRLLRCNPFSKGGYDPVPENYFKKRWIV